MIKDNLKSVHKRINAACKRVNRDPSEITLVCVTKGIDPYSVSEVFVHGIKDIGENKVQEAAKKKGAVLPGANWHMIGHLQTNKVKAAIDIFSLIHSVDSLELAVKIDKEAGKIGKIVDMLIQVNVAGEESKYGISPEEMFSFLSNMSALGNIRVLGLMAMMPLSDDPEATRPYMKRMREIFGGLKNEAMPNIEMKYLSMGMSRDFEVAIEEGSNMLRIGTAIFGG